MAQSTNITDGIQAVSSTGPVAPSSGLSVASYSSDYTLSITVSGMTAAASARLQFEVSVDSFATVTVVAVLDLSGQILPQAPVCQSWRAYQLGPNASTLIGTAGAAIRLNCTELSAEASMNVLGQIWA